MKAMVLRERGGPFVLEERPEPVPGPEEAVVRVLACGAGLTIHHTRVGRGKASYPLVIGHEITGEIASLGEGAEDLAVGDAVTAYFYLTCGKCRLCRTDRETLCENNKGYIGRQIDGGYAEYMKAPAGNFLKLPPGLDYKRHPAEVAVITDAVATPFKVVRRARVKPLENVAVFGAGGGLGIHMVMMTKWAGARVIAVDISPGKLDKCRDAGADETVDASKGDVTGALMDLTGGKGVDVSIDFVSSASTHEAGALALGYGGRLVTLGGNAENFEAPANLMREKELELMGSRYATKQEVLDALALTARGDVWPLVTETYKLEEAEKVHARLEAGAITGRAAILMD